MAVDLNSRTLALLVALAAPCMSWAMGSAAPFVPPRSASAPELALATDTDATKATTAAAPSADGLIGVRLGVLPMALIDGQWWHVGNALRGARLQTVDAWGVTLRHPDGKLERLLLHSSSSLQPRPDSRAKGQHR